MAKLNFLGIGPKMAIVFIPWLFVTIIISIINKDFFVITSVNKNLILIIGIGLMVPGLIFYFSTVRLLLKGLNDNRLMTKGAYRLCQNPLYAVIFIIIIPSLSLIMNSWLVLTSGIVGYILFRIYIKSEYKELEKCFGEEYLKYKNETPEFFPIPFKKWFSKHH